MTADGAPTASRGGASGLVLRNVSVRYGSRVVLDRITLTVEPGRFVGVIGANGAGKSTLLKAILDVLPAVSGEILLDGQPVRRGSRRVGYVPQSYQIEPDMPVTAWDVVAMGLDGERWGVPWVPRRQRHRVDAMMERVGASAYADAPAGRLSGGERQRLLVGQALLADPALLLMDEPLANLDLRSTQDIVQLVADLQKERGITVLLVAHDMNPLMPVMDGLIYLAGGRAAAGRVDEVVRADVLSALYGEHVDVVRVHGRVLVVAGEGADPGSPDHIVHDPDGEDREA